MTTIDDAVESLKRDGVEFSGPATVGAVRELRRMWPGLPDDYVYFVERYGSGGGFSGVYLGSLDNGKGTVVHDSRRVVSQYRMVDSLIDGGGTWVTVYLSDDDGVCYGLVLNGARSSVWGLETEVTEGGAFFVCDTFAGLIVDVAGL